VYRAHNIIVYIYILEINVYCTLLRTRINQSGPTSVSQGLEEF